MYFCNSTTTKYLSETNINSCQPAGTRTRPKTRVSQTSKFNKFKLRHTPSRQCGDTRVLSRNSSANDYSAYPVIGITSDRHNGATFFGSLGGGQDQIIPSFRIGIFCLPFHGGLDASSSDDTQKHPDFQNFSRKRCMKFLVLPLT